MGQRGPFYIRTIRPELTANFARSHDDQICCFCRLLRSRPDAVAPNAKAATSLPLARSAFTLREAAHWATWPDTMKMVRTRHPRSKRPSCKQWRHAMKFQACKPSTKTWKIWWTLVSLHPLGKSWPLRLCTLHTLKTESPINPEWGGKHKQLAWSRLLGKFPDDIVQRRRCAL